MGTVPCFDFQTSGYDAGYTGDDVFLNFTEWTPTEISIDRLGGGYGLGEWKSFPGDSVRIVLWNSTSSQKTTWHGKLPDIPHVKDAGLDITGARSENETATIQSQRSFSPPLNVHAKVVGKIASDEPFILAIASADGSEGISLDGVLYDGNPHCGMRDRFAGGEGKSWTGFEENLGGGSAVNIQYDIAIAVDIRGVVTIKVMAEGVAAKWAPPDSVTRQVGLGPFYVLLMQHEGIPYHSYFRDGLGKGIADTTRYIIGPNEAIWQWISVYAGTWGRYQLVDDFTKDDSLNTDLWKVNGPVGDLVGRNIGNPPSKIVKPTIEFLKEQLDTAHDSSNVGMNRR